MLTISSTVPRICDRYGWHHRQRREPSRAGSMVKLGKIDRSIVRTEDSPQTKRESIRGHNQTGSDVRERMLSDEGKQQEENYEAILLFFNQGRHTEVQPIYGVEFIT